MRSGSASMWVVALATSLVVTTSVASNGIESLLDVVHHAIASEDACDDADIGDCDDDCPPACGDCGDCARCLRIVAPIAAAAEHVARPAESAMRIARAPDGAPSCPDPAEILVVPRA